MITAGVIFGVLLAMILVALVWRWGGGDWDRHFGFIESLLAISALVGGAVWYFVSRPDAAKLKVEQTLTAYAAPNNRVLLIAELSLSNVGGRSLKLTSQEYRIWVQQVTPFAPKVAQEYQADDTRERPRRVFTADTWGRLAKVDGVIDTEIEAGESEYYYHRVVLPCQPHLTVSVANWISRPKSDWPFVNSGEDGVAWTKQSFIDVKDQCIEAKKWKEPSR